MNNYENIKRYVWIMCIGVFLNLSLYQIAHIYHLPMWIDNVGTAYAALLLEPAAGLLVGFATNFYQAAVIYDSSSLIYYAVTASAALSIGILMRKEGRIYWKHIFRALICYFVISVLLSTLFTLWRTSGVPDSSWEHHFYSLALSRNLPLPLACLFGVAVLKVNDILVMLVVLPLLYKITPKHWINVKQKEVISWKNPYFHHKTDKIKEE